MNAMNESTQPQKGRGTLRRARTVLRLFIHRIRRLFRIRSMTPEALIDDIADRHGLEVVILKRVVGANPCVRPEEAAVAIYAIAQQAGICVTLLCPLKNLKETLQRKIIYSRWN